MLQKQNILLLSINAKIQNTVDMSINTNAINEETAEKKSKYET